MEIINWFYFFFSMIFLSFLSWTQIFILFIITNIIIAGNINYNTYKKSYKWYHIILIKIIDIIQFIAYYVRFYCRIFTSKTTIGLYIKKFFTYMEYNYQLIKNQTKSEIFKQLINNVVVNNTCTKTPRISYDTDDTDDE